MSTEQKYCHLASSLFDETLKLCKEHPSQVKLAEEAGVPYFWLRKFTKGEIPDPGVNRVQRLYETLTGQSLLGGVDAE